MNEDGALRSVLRVLVERGIPHAIDGSIACGVYGGIHSTRDVEIVVPIDPDRLEPVFDALETDFEIDRLVQPETATSGRRFPLRHRHSSLVVNLFLPAEDAFEHCRFKRRLADTYLGQPTFLMSPEDVVLQEAIWLNQLGPRGWREDLVAVLRVQGAVLDWTYIEYWANRQGTGHLIGVLSGAIHPNDLPLDENII